MQSEPSEALETMLGSDSAAGGVYNSGVSLLKRESFRFRVELFEPGLGVVA